MSFWVQRAGRAARGHGRKGLAVMLVEKTAFETGVETTRSGRQQRVARRKKRASTADCEAEEGGVETAEDAGDAGQSRGRTTPSCAVRSAGGTAAAPEVPRDSPGEGLYIYIQTTTICRRVIMGKIFGNEKVLTGTVPPSECCDVCNARLFDRTRPFKPIVAVRQQAAKKRLVVPTVRLALYEWRRDIKKSRYFPYGVQLAILDDDTCEKLASVGPIPSKDTLQQHLCGRARWHTFGDSLLLIQTLTARREATQSCS
ncbi:hypothetical protein B0H13DRAFT_1898009 [Mycena leptocephala]|nr:hypothetical protein B0H13DRAFT_1898009 [Mycena leptocephala]